MPFASTGREALNANERLWQWKFGLRSIVIVFAVISIGLLGSILGKLRFDHYYYDMGLLAATNLWCCVAVCRLPSASTQTGEDFQLTHANSLVIA